MGNLISEINKNTVTSLIIDIIPKSSFDNISILKTLADPDFLIDIKTFNNYFNFKDNNIFNSVDKFSSGYINIFRILSLLILIKDDHPIKILRNYLDLFSVSKEEKLNKDEFSLAIEYLFLNLELIFNIKPNKFDYEEALLIDNQIFLNSNFILLSKLKKTMEENITIVSIFKMINLKIRSSAHS